MKLLRECSNAIQVTGTAVELRGRSWAVDTVDRSSLGEDQPYVCVSYAHGPRRVPHPFMTGGTMSDRAVGAAEAALSAQNPTSLWVDAFCAGDASPDSLALTELGIVFGGARTVVVVLDEPCRPLLECMLERDWLDPESLSTLELDPFVTRSWTYQEVVNSPRIQFTTFDGGGLCVEADDFFRLVACAVDDYRKARGWTGFQMREAFPRLNSLIDMLLDWKVDPYLQRTAYRVMVSMDQRQATHSDDYFWAMVGALTNEPPIRAGAQKPAEVFMEICETRGDFSFVYSASERTQLSGRRWRPCPTRTFASVLQWHTYGKGQCGRLRPTHLELDDMWFPPAGMTSPEARRWALRWSGTDADRVHQSEVPRRLLGELRKARFTGCGAVLETADGYFFPQRPLPRLKQAVIAVSAGLRMTLGGPGMLLFPSESESGTYEFGVVGIFVGRVKREGRTICVS